MLPLYQEKDLKFLKMMLGEPKRINLNISITPHFYV